MEKREDSIHVLMVYTIFLVQIHDLPIRCMSEGMTKQLGNFIGKFLEFDTIIVTRGENFHES